MRPKPAAITAALCLLSVSTLGAQDVAFSRRVYQARGRSYQQIWIWSADAGRLTQVSRGERDHNSPMCEAGGRHILFDAVGGVRGTRWRLDRVTGDERPLDPPTVGAGRARETARAAASECDDGTAVLSPDASRAACVVQGTDILVADAGTLQPVVRVPFGQQYSNGEPYAPWPMELIWSPDGRALLVGNYGESGSSTNSQLDYFLLDLASRMWTRGFTGADAMWPTATLIVYVTPRDLSPLDADGAHSVWTAHLTAFDPIAHRTRPITDGLSNDLSPALCAR